MPRDGPGVVLRSGHRPPHQRRVRRHQGGSRGAPRRGPHLHGCGDRAHRPGWLAAHRLPHPRGQPLLRRNLLPPGGPPRPPRLRQRAPGGAGGLGDTAGRGRRRRGRTGPAPGHSPASPRRGSRPRGAPLRLSGHRGIFRPGARRLRRRPQVPAGGQPGVPAAGRRGRMGSPRRGDGRADPGRHGRRRHPRPGRRRLRPLRRGRALAHPPLREDALRQRPPRPPVPARGTGHRGAGLRHRGPLHPGLPPRRPRPARGRVRRRRGRRQRGGGGPLLRRRLGRVLRRRRRRRLTRRRRTRGHP